MIGKKINQLATELAPASTDLTIIGDPISGVSKKITIAQLGAIFSGAVSFYDNFAAFPATGDINVIYCAKDTQKLYLWSGSAYTEVFPSQALLDTYQLRSEKGNANGYASLDSGGKVPISQLPSSIMEYKGTWNAATNTPTLANGTGDTGDVYICNVAGTVNFGAGPLTFAVGDYVIYSGSIWQRSSGAVGTVTSVGLSTNGNSITIGSSPVTTSGTISANFVGNSTQYINGAGNLTTFPTLTGYVPYTGATANVDLGTFDLTADILTAATGSYTSSGGGNTLEVTHSSGSGIALNITKAGNGEGLYINKTSGSGNAATIIGTLSATTLVKSGGTSSQFLKADGSVDSTAYGTGSVTSVAALTIGTTGTDLSSTVANSTTTPVITLNVPTASATNRGALSSADWTTFNNKQNTLTNPVTGTGTTNYIAKFTGTSTIGNSLVFDNGTNVGIGTITPGEKLVVSDGTVNWYVNPNAANSSAFIGTSTNHALSFVTNGNERVRITNAGQVGIGTTNPSDKLTVTDTFFTFNIGAAPAGAGTLLYSLGSGGITFSTNTKASERMTITNGGNVGIGTNNPTFLLDVSGTIRVTGASTFSNLAGTGTRMVVADANGLLSTQAIGSGAITGSGTTNYIPKFTGTSTIGNSQIFDNGTNVGIGTTSPLQKLHVYNSASSSAAIFQGSSNSYIQLGVTNESYIGNVSGALLLETGGSTRLTVSSAGNVGIGTTSPSSKLHVKGVLSIERSDAAQISTISNEGGNFYISSASGFNTIFQDGSTERMRISTSGNVGIGTTNPLAKLDVNGAFNSTTFVTNNSSTTINSSTNVNTAVLDCGIVVFRDRTNGGGCVVFYENNQTPIIISQSGATIFTLVTPLASQIQISNRSGARGLQALGGSSRNGVNLGWAVFRTEGGDA